MAKGAKAVPETAVQLLVRLARTARTGERVPTALLGLRAQEVTTENSD